MTQDEAKKAAALAALKYVPESGVVGLGTMGAGIAQVCVQAGVETVGREVTAELGERARARIAHYLGRGVEKGRLTAEERDAALGRLTTTTELSELAGCDLVIEAVVEELDAKREIFAELDRLLPDAVLATNTSALPVREIAAAAERSDRVVGMHFFNPAPVLPLVEVVAGHQPSDDDGAAGEGEVEQQRGEDHPLNVAGRRGSMGACPLDAAGCSARPGVGPPRWCASRC